MTLSDPARKRGRGGETTSPAAADAADAAEQPPERQAGMIVAGRYQLLHLLGEGGMGSVWAAKHLQTRKRVALKFVKRLGGASATLRRRALREARAASVVRHPNILGVQDIIDVDGVPMLVMDLVEGEPLSRYLARRGSLSLTEAAPILERVVSAIAMASAAGVIHRDLKPDNIFLASVPGGGHEVKVLDFGLAKMTATEGDAASSGALTRDGEVMGTPHYMAPEQAFGDGDIDHRADIWALGIIIYECLAGFRPFPGDNLGQVLRRLVSQEYVPLAQAVPGLPDDVTALVDGMLAFDRSARPADLRHASEVLRRHGGADAPSLAPPPPASSASGSAPSRGARPRWQRVGLAVAVAAVTAALGIGATVRLLPRSSRTAPAAAQTVARTPTPPAEGPSTAPAAPAAPIPPAAVATIGAAGPERGASAAAPRPAGKRRPSRASSRTAHVAATATAAPDTAAGPAPRPRDAKDVAKDVDDKTVPLFAD